MKHNVILIVLDTLREDFSANLESLTRSGFVKYSNAIANAPWTVPSHASIFTGLLPSQHQVHEARDRKNTRQYSFEKLGQGIRLLDYLGRRGYHSYALTCNPYITNSFGYSFFDCKLFNRDGEVNISKRSKSARGMRLEGNFGILASKAYRKAQRLLGSFPIEKGSKHVVSELRSHPLAERVPFFLFVNLMEAHEPYSKVSVSHGYINKRNYVLGIPPPYRLKWEDRYGKHADFVISRLFNIKEILSPLLDDSLVIVTSDHGQLIGEKGRYGHSYYLDDELLRVPLYVKYPKGTKIPSRRGNFVGLSSIPSLVEGVIEEREVEIGSSAALAESFGPHKVWPRNETETEFFNEAYAHRIKVYADGGSAVLNLSSGKIEDREGNIPDGVVRDAIGNLPTERQTSSSPTVPLAETFTPQEEEALNRNLRDLGYS